MKKIKNFKIKNCEDCFFGQSAEELNQKEFCAGHHDKEDQPRGIIKKIRVARKDLYKGRIILGTITLLVGLGFFYGAFTLPSYYQNGKAHKDFGSRDFYLSVIGLMVKCGVYLPILGGTIYRNEKDAQHELKALNRQKREGIIEYEI